MNHNINRAFQIIYIHQSWHIVMRVLKKNGGVLSDMNTIIATAMGGTNLVQLRTVSGHCQNNQ